MPEHKYGRPKKRNIDQETVGKFLNNLGFKIESISQEWRHLHAFGKYEGRDAVFKMASTQITSPRTQNEYFWNEAVYLVPGDKRPSFTVPENYFFGYFGKLFYFIAERFTGEPLAGNYAKITQIAKATFELCHLPLPVNCPFVQAQKIKRSGQISAGSQLFQSAAEWANQVPRDLTAFLKVVDQAKAGLRTSVGHGDFVIRQMFDVNGKIGIIDGEHAGIKGPLYYDAAQFYLRLRNDQYAKETAQKYLREFRDLLPPADKRTFWTELKPVLIQRYIGDLWGAAKNPRKLDELEALGQEILDNQIV